MWPKQIDWKTLRFGVEIEFIGGKPAELPLLPDWEMSLDELQIDETGAESGSELKTPPILWEEREQIRIMLTRLTEQGAQMNWSCGLHVHIGIEPWGEAMVLPIVDAALAHQDALRDLVGMSSDRLIYCLPVTEEMRTAYVRNPGQRALRRKGRPQSHRCGINAAAWYDIGTVEIRYANGSLDYEKIIRTIELYLRFVAAIGEGRELPHASEALAIALGAPLSGYPPAIPTPRWYQERVWLEEALIPIVSGLANELLPGGEIHHILPVSDGIAIEIIDWDGKQINVVCRPPSTDWQILRVETKPS
ncbi:amidoligase family protein [Paenibacillus sp. R14(2021)]|uniref:amidoligase family protein n=1 Tax=Paenibacillus sp. R14(2021) TaxID=2859228 RepID=UPI001C614BAD|nr:amidoligase family protein [Paenibacillus sp. R14(2021)]